MGKWSIPGIRIVTAIKNTQENNYERQKNDNDT